MVDRMDQGIGRIVESLRSAGRLDNTLILFLQDNGGCAEATGRSPDKERAAKPTLPPIPADALRQDVIPKQTRDGWPMLNGRLVMPGPADTFIAYGRDWANVSNTPFREYKHWEHEGGISTPLIAHWPAGIPAARLGGLERQPGHLIDLMATAVDLSGAPYPAKRKEVDVPPMEGTSLRPALEGKPLARTAPIFWEHEGNRAMRDGKWKLVSKHSGGWELYDMEADRPEQHSLAAKEPDRVREMSAQWETWAKRVGVEPWPVQKPGPKKP
jgi:arylsulfatase